MSEETLEISFDEIEKEREKYLLVDTRDKVTVEYGMIPGAISVPEQELEERAEELKGDKIPVLYCTRGLFSQEGAGMLREKGIPALSLKGGYTGWLFQQMRKESNKGDSEEEENEAMEQRRKDIELSIRKKFHKQLFSRFARGINDYELVKPGDKIAVCISGGKDSMLMAKLFQELKRHNKFPFELVFLVMDPGYNEANRAVIEHNAKLLGIPITVFETEIFDAVYNVEKSPCYLCARMRRGYLYSKAKELGCNKIALGHHYDDVIETILMGMLYSGQIQTMMPTTMTQTITMPVFFRVSARVGQETFFSSDRSSRKNRAIRLPTPGFFSLSALAFAFSLSALAGLVSFAFSSAPSWFIFSFSDIQFHPSFLQGMWAIIT